MYRSGRASSCREGGPPTFLNRRNSCSPQVGWYLVILGSRLLLTLTLTLTLALGANALHGGGLLLPGGVGQRVLHQLVLQQALGRALQAQTVLLAPPAHQAHKHALALAQANSTQHNLEQTLIFNCCAGLNLNYCMHDSMWAAHEQGSWRPAHQVVQSKVSCTCSWQPGFA